MRILKKILRRLAAHKYITTLVVFVLIIGYFDSNSLYDRWKLYNEEKALRKQINEYRNQYNRDTKLYHELQCDPNAAVRIAREHYYMKKDNEDVYIFENETTQ